MKIVCQCFCVLDDEMARLLHFGGRNWAPKFQKSRKSALRRLFHSLNESSLENGFDMSYRTLVRQLNRAF